MRTASWILIVGLMFSTSYLLLYKRYMPDPVYPNLQKQIEELLPLKQREERIKSMEKALMIQYDLSWYEAHYYSIIYDDFAKKYNCPWTVFPAITRIESNFDPTVMSPKAAKGITQVLESTARPIAKDLGIRYEDSKTLWNDLLNMIIGYTYLGQNIQAQGLENGVKAYLGGPGFDRGRKDIGDYRTTVRKEFIRLSYIHQGVLNTTKDSLASVFMYDSVPVLEAVKKPSIIKKPLPIKKSQPRVVVTDTTQKIVE